MEVIFEHVTKRIGNSTVIDDVSLVIPSGKITGLKGVNGSGKTMMMRLMAGFIYPTSGTVSVDGKVLGKELSFPPGLGVMLENPAFLNDYSGYDNLRLLADIRAAADEQRIREVMELVGLQENGHKKYRKFSLGMKQRLGIAAACMECPDLLLLDEPTNSLDADGVEMVKRIVRMEKERGAAVVISCHDAQVLDELADEVFSLQSGKITGSYIPGRAEL